MPIPLVTRILVADDHPIVRSGLKTVLDAQPDLEVVAEADDGAEAVKKALAEDVASRHPRRRDAEADRHPGRRGAAQRKPELKLLMLSMYDSEQFLFESLRAGASGYVLKSDADQDIVDAVPANDARPVVPLPVGGRDPRRATTWSAAVPTTSSSTSSRRASSRC